MASGNSDRGHGVFLVMGGPLDTPPPFEGSGQVRPLPEERPEVVPRARRTLPSDVVRTMMVGFGALAVGILIGTTSWRTATSPTTLDPPTQATTTVDPLLAAPVGAGDPAENSSTTVPASTTSTTTPSTTTTQPRPTLAQMIPAMGGRSLVGVGSKGAWRWSAGGREPVIVATGSDAEGQWDPTGRYMAVSKRWDNDGWSELWVLSGTTLRPVHLDAQGFFWHPTEPKLAFFGRSTSSGPTELLIATAHGGRGFEVDRSVPLPFEPHRDEWLWMPGWGEWGFLVAVETCDESGGCRSIVTSLSPEGEVVGEIEGTNIASVSPTGRILLVDYQGEHGDPTNARWTDLTFRTTAPAEEFLAQNPWGIQWAPDGSRYLVTTWDETNGTQRTLVVEGDTTTALTGIEWVTGVSPDGRLVVGVPTGGYGRSLVVVDLETNEWQRLSLPFESWTAQIGER